METIGWFRRPQLLATGDWQLHHNNMPAHASHLMQSFLVKHQITQVTQCPLQLRFGALQLLAFPKTKLPLKGKRFQTIDESQENTTGKLMETGRTRECEVPSYLLWRGLRCHCPMYGVSCFLYLLHSVSLFFIIHGWIPSQQPHIPYYMVGK